MRAETKFPVGLPENLRQQFAVLQRQLWRKQALVAVCGIGLALLTSYLLLFISDRIWETPAWLRLIFILAGLLAASGFLFRWIVQAFWKPYDPLSLAKLVQKKHRRLGDRLLGIVELANEEKRPKDISPALCRAAINQVSTEAARYDFVQAVDRRRPGIFLRSFAALLAIIFLAGLLMPQAGWNSFQRWLFPTASIPRYTFVHLDGLISPMIVPHGESFDVHGSVNYLSFWRPGRPRAQFGSQPWIDGTVTNNRLQFRVAGQTEPGVLKLRLGDAQAGVQVQPTFRPALEELTASIQLPDYLQHPPLKQRIQNTALKVLEGSQASFHGKINRPLSQARLQMNGDQSEPLTIQEGAFQTGSLALDELARASFTWTDHYGLDGSAPWALVIETEKDQPPRPEFTDLPREVVLLETEVLEIKTAARDDYGVREFGMSWNVPGETLPSNSALSQDFQVQSPSPNEKRLETNFYFSPSIFEIAPGSVVELRAWATDFHPGREPSQSAVHRIYVLGREQHAEMIRQQLESLLAQVEEITRTEETLAQNTRELRDAPEDSAQSGKTGERAAEEADKQNQNARALEQITREGMETVREALRNPVFSEDTLREWAENFRELQNIAQSDMGEATSQLQSASQNQEQQSEQLAAAQKTQEEIIKALQEMQERIHNSLDNLQALTLAERLRKISGEEKQLETKLQRMIAETIGLRPDELPEELKRANSLLADEQEETRKDSHVLQGEISRFYDRTQQPNYGEVSQEMEEQKTDEELYHIRELIQANIGMQASTRLAEWSRQFQSWADRLAPPPSDGSSGGGEGGGEGEHPLIKQLMALIRLREQENNVRARTRLLENRKADHSAYHTAAQKLFELQSEMTQALRQVEDDNSELMLVQLLSDSHDAMVASRDLLEKPQTDNTTIEAQTRAIVHLSDAINLINEQRQQGEQNSPSESAMNAEMAFLMQLMSSSEPGFGMAAGDTPGGSTAGGSTEQPSIPIPGDIRGARPGSRSVEKGTGGGDSHSYPSEFREALENYFQALEQIQP
jgi:hypothetical protein